ncbi:MAG: mannitol dehydrogenase family protein [Synergistaceae bacterium]|nr:mannitol dehydrogenase family protein [Synergistaceae bacterium]
MKLSRELLENLDHLKNIGYRTPRFDAAAVARRTLDAPDWLHFGAGNIFRAFLAGVLQESLDEGKSDRGVVAVEGYDYELVDAIFRAHGNLSLTAILNDDGSVTKTLTASICDALKADPGGAPEDWARLVEMFKSPGLRVVSFTITEKGYSLTDAGGGYMDAVAADFENGPEKPVSYMGKVASLLCSRWRGGAKPVAMASMDNCSSNGEKLEAAIRTFAEKWSEGGKVHPGFLEYIGDRSRVSFPWSMIDKITPSPAEKVRSMFEADGFTGMETVVTQKHTRAAAFVNAEKPQYLVLEDWFPAGRVLPEGGGVYYTDRERVSRTETMKVTACLNPLHTALAVMGCLLGYELISEEMADDDLRDMTRRLGRAENMPAAEAGVIDPEDFLEEVLTKRFPNPFMPDTPQRIASDTSQKMPIRFGETLKTYMRKGLDMERLEMIPLVQAAWLRYLLGIDDGGGPMEISPDPRAHDLRAALAGVVFGRPGDYHDILRPILSDEKLFGVNLYDTPLGLKVEELLNCMLAGPGAVRKTLRETVRRGAVIPAGS